MKNDLFKKALILIFIIFLISLYLIFNSCTEEQYVKGTVWVGELDYDNSGDKGKMEIFFYDNNEIEAYVEFNNDENYTNHYGKLEGTYEITDTYTFEAELDARLKLDDDNINDKVTIKLEGTLDFIKNYGEGDFDMNLERSLDGDMDADGSWEIEKSN